MEDGEAMSSGKEQGASYTYWVREVTQEAAPLTVPRKLNPEDISSQPRPATLGSVWNRAGTWEEKNLNKWASDRIKELLKSMGSLEFSDGKAEITNVPKCIGDINERHRSLYDWNTAECRQQKSLAFLVTVRNKKRVGYTYELTLTIKGEWKIREDKTMVEAHIDIPEFSFGELDDLQMEVRISEEKDLLHQDKLQINRDLKRFLQPVREILLQFEQELKDR